MCFEWIDADAVAHDKLAFYLAREEPDGQPSSPKRAAAKKTGRTTIASLSAQLLTVQQQLQVVMAQQDARSL